MGLFNDYTDIEYKVKTEPRKHELSLSVVIPFHAGRDILAKTVTSLTQQTYPKDRIEVIIAGLMPVMPMQNSSLNSMEEK